MALQANCRQRDNHHQTPQQLHLRSIRPNQTSGIGRRRKNEQDNEARHRRVDPLGQRLLAPPSSFTKNGSASPNPNTSGIISVVRVSLTIVRAPAA